jgi:hypothetical protein
MEGDDAGAGVVSTNVWRVAKTGGPRELVAGMTAATVYPDGNPVAVGGGRVAWGEGTQVVAMAVDGGAHAVLATQTPSVGTLAADDSFLYWVPGNTAAAQSSWQIVCVAGDPSCVPPPIESPEGGVFDVPWGGGPWLGIAPGANVAHLVSDSPVALYGVEPSAGPFGPVVRIDFSSGLQSIFAGGGPIGGLAIDATTLYWSRGSKLLASPLGQ